jgi:putative tryptophan/tyrosine transport system substrate-binding protein
MSLRVDVRKFVLNLISSALLLLPVHCAFAQQPKKTPRIGVLRPGLAAAPNYEAFRQGLRELGYVEDQNVVLELRDAEAKAERLADLSAELVRLKVDVIVTSSTPAIQSVKQATATIPIVMAFSGDPVGTGLVASLAKPGGNITELSDIGPEISGKQLELLKEAFPTILRVALFLNPSNQGNRLRLKAAEVTAGVLKVQIQSLEVQSANDFEKAFSTISKGRVLARDGRKLLWRLGTRPSMQTKHGSWSSRQRTGCLQCPHG